MGKGYVPEGSYFIHREMFENEEETIAPDPPSFNNWLVNSLGTSDFAQDPDLYVPWKALNLRACANIDIQHLGAMDSNDFVQEFTIVYNPQDNLYVHGRWCTINFRDINNNFVARIRLGEDATPLPTVEFYDPVLTAWITTPIETLHGYDEWHEVKVIFHNDHSYFPNRIELLVDGYKLWKVAGPALDNDPTGDELIKETNSRISTYDVQAGGNFFVGVGWIFRGFICKDWADMTLTDVATPTESYHDGVPEGCPYFQPIVEANDHATWIKLKPWISDISGTLRFNESSEFRLTLNPQDVNAIFENMIVDDDSDDDYQHFTYDAKAMIFLQMSTLIFHGYKGNSVNNHLFGDNFVLYGVEVGDVVWLFKKDCAIDNPYVVTGFAAANELELDHDINGGAVTTEISYLICRGHDRIFSKSLGDYIFQGRFKNREYRWSQSPSVELLFVDDLYIAIQHHVYCKATRYYRKYIDEILYGHFNDPPDQVVDGIATQGNYSGILGLDIPGVTALWLSDTAYLANTVNCDTTTKQKVVTKIWDQSMSLYEVIRSLCDYLNIQFTCYTDYEFRNERVLFFRDRMDFDTDPILINYYPGDNAYTEDDTTKSITEATFTKGTRDFIDRSFVLGADAGDNYGNPLYGDYPPNYPIDGFTRDTVMSDNAIRTQQLSDGDAYAIYRDLHRTPEQGNIATEPIAQADTWFDGVYLDDDNVRDYYQRHDGDYGGVFCGDSDWFNNWLPGGYDENDKDRTSQGHLHRKPFSIVGETAEFHYTAMNSFGFIINALSTGFSHTEGIMFSTEPNTLPYSVSRDLSDKDRKIAWVGEQFKDPLVKQCTIEPLPKDGLEITQFLQAGLMPTAGFYNIVPGGAGTGLIRLDFTPMSYTDEVDSTSSYAYLFYYSTTGAGWGSFVGLPIVGAPLPVTHVLPDIDNTTQTIMLNNDPGGNWGFGAGVNWVNLAGPPGLNTVLCVVLCNRYLLDATPTYHYIPRNAVTFVPNQSGVYYADEYYQIMKGPDIIVNFP